MATFLANDCKVCFKGVV